MSHGAAIWQLKWDKLGRAGEEQRGGVVELGRSEVKRGRSRLN